MSKMTITGTRQYKKLSIHNNLVWLEDLILSYIYIPMVCVILTFKGFFILELLRPIVYMQYASAVIVVIMQKLSIIIKCMHLSVCTVQLLNVIHI